MRRLWSPSAGIGLVVWCVVRVEMAFLLLGKGRGRGGGVDVEVDMEAVRKREGDIVGIKEKKGKKGG